MAQKLVNPLVAIISSPMQLNYERDFGVYNDGDRLLVNNQLVVLKSETIPV